jgi:hypothetical protein
VNEIDPVETLKVCVLVADKTGTPSTVKLLLPTASIIAALTLFGFMVRFPVPPPAVVTDRVPPLKVKVVVEITEFPIIRDAQTAEVVIERFTPELIVTSSLFVGTCPALHVAVAQVPPPAATAIFGAVAWANWILNPINNTVRNEAIRILLLNRFVVVFMVVLFNGG